MYTPSPTVVLHVGDVLTLLKTFPDNHFDDLFCDPPYGLSFMGYEWDHGVPSKAVWKEALRVLKPGGHLLAYGGTRKWHRLGVNIEDGGFEIRDTMMWLYGQGFPKAHDISKAIDKAAGEEREATTEAETWEGYKTALKPAWEPLVLGMKSTEGTYAANALKHGVAGLNIDGSRIASSSPVQKTAEGVAGFNFEKENMAYEKGTGRIYGTDGRYPANLVLQHHPECVCTGTRKVKSQNPSYAKAAEGSKGQGGYMEGWEGRPKGVGIGYANEDGTETIDAWECHADCPVSLLDAQTGVLKSGTGAVKRRSSSDHDGNGGTALGKESRPEGTEMISYGDEGGASRFFYQAKASKSEREAGLTPPEGKKRANTHPTVKPIELNRYFANLLLPPPRSTARKILVPFSGVASEVIGALQAGWEHVEAIEINPEYVTIAQQRIAHHVPDAEVTIEAHENKNEDE